jgi:hypothetical protein
MPHPNFFHSFDDLRGLTVAELATRLIASPKKIVGDVTVAELCAASQYPNGLYFFFDESNESWYVGKSTSRSFIERVPSHFDQREDAWFNTLPRKLMKFCGIGEYPDAHELSLTLHVVLLGVREKHTAMRLESALRDYMQPHLNPGKRSRCLGTEPLAGYEG